jgi:multiple sugar transport system permease protein
MQGMKGEGVTPMQARGSSLRRGEIGVAAVMLAPILLAVVVLRIWPTLDALWVSVAPADPDGSASLGSYAALFQDPSFVGAIVTTLIFSVIVNPFQILLALALALLLDKRVLAGGLWRTLILLPVVIPQSVSALIWGVAFRPDGPLNAILAALGFPQQPFLTSPNEAMLCIIIMVSWVGVGYWMTFLIAGLKDIPVSLYDAAVIDGATAWQSFLSITLPMLRRPLLFVLVADTVSNFLVFAPVQILTNGGPDGSTNFIIFAIFTRAFTYADAQGAAAATVVLVAVVLAVVAVQFRMLQKDGV